MLLREIITVYCKIIRNTYIHRAGKMKSILPLHVAVHTVITGLSSFRCSWAWDPDNQEVWFFFCPNTEQIIFQMQFVIWVLKPGVVGICLSVTSKSRTATLYEAQQDLHFINL